MPNTVVISDGEQLRLEEFVLKIPMAFVVPTSIHREIVTLFAKNKFCESTEEYKIYCNLLCHKSRFCRYLSALIYFNQYSAERKVEKVYCGSIPSSVIRMLAANGINYANNNQIRFDYLDLRRGFFLVKFLISYLYILMSLVKFNFREELNRSLIRSWVEISEHLFQEHYNHSLILIYPFGIRPTRQLKYFLRCLRSKKAVQLTGINYNFKDLFYVLFSRNYDINLVKFELNGFINHSNWLRKKNPNKLYTTDDFEVASLACHSRLTNVKIVNSAHGIGFYNLYIHYTSFLVFNEAQKEYYEQFNDHVEYKVRKSPMTISNLCKDKETYLVYIFGGMEQKGIYHKNQFNYELIMEGKIIEEIKKVSNNLGIKAIIKIHPNTSNRTIKYLEETYHLPAKRKIDFDSINPIYFNIVSTAYFDFSKYGQVIFVIDDLLKPELYFGKEIITSRIENLKSIVSTYLQ